MAERRGVRLSAAVSRALTAGEPVVALESSVLAQGLPVPANRDGARRMIGAVEAGGAVPGITAVVRGSPTIGLESAELERFLDRGHPIAKLSARDVPWAVARGLDGATTVAGTLLLAVRAGVPVFATGGIGGVHRGASYDESADLVELGRSPIVVVCAGAKAILDLRATYERLETLGVLVVGYRTSEFPGFFTESSGIRLSLRVESAAELARVYRAQRLVGHAGALLVVQPPPKDVALTGSEVDDAVHRAEVAARVEGISGAELTPYLLEAIRRETGERSLDVNLALLERNAALAAEVAGALASAGGVAVSAHDASGRQGPDGWAVE